MTFYICDRNIPDCIGRCFTDCKHTSDINHRKSKEYPITFKVVKTFIHGKGTLWEVPYVDTEGGHK